MTLLKKLELDLTGHVRYSHYNDNSNHQNPSDRLAMKGNGFD